MCMCVYIHVSRDGSRPGAVVIITVVLLGVSSYFSLLLFFFFGGGKKRIGRENAERERARKILI